MAEIRKVSQLALRRFVLSEAGQEVVAALKDETPQVVSGQPHEIILAAGKAQGHRECIDKIISLSDQAVQREIEIENPGLER